MLEGRNGIWKMPGRDPSSGGACVAGGGARPAELGVRLRDDRRLRTQVEQRVRPFVGVADHRVDIGHDSGAALVRDRIAEICGQLLHPLLHRSLGAAKLAEDRIHIAFDAAHLRAGRDRESRRRSCSWW
jgi:hypothetical protein